jgi:hypothetical protein
VCMLGRFFPFKKIEYFFHFHPLIFCWLRIEINNLFWFFFLWDYHSFIFVSRIWQVISTSKVNMGWYNTIGLCSSRKGSLGEEGMTLNKEMAWLISWDHFESFPFIRDFLFSYNIISFLNTQLGCITFH